MKWNEMKLVDSCSSRQVAQKRHGSTLDVFVETGGVQIIECMVAAIPRGKHHFSSDQ